MAQLEIVDRTWIAAPPSRVASALADPRDWAIWWPRLRLVVREQRGVRGVRWTVTAPEDHASGTMEIWVQACFEGAVVHYFLRLDPRSPGDGEWRPRRRRRLRLRYSVRTRRLLWTIKDQLERRAVRDGNGASSRR